MAECWLTLQMSGLSLRPYNAATQSTHNHAYNAGAKTDPGFSRVCPGIPVSFMLSAPGWSCRERKAGWYSAAVYLAHKMVEEVGVAALMTLPFSCILYFPMQLHGTWALFWMVYFVTSTIGIGELLQLSYHAAAIFSRHSSALCAATG